MTSPFEKKIRTTQHDKMVGIALMLRKAATFFDDEARRDECMLPQEFVTKRDEFIVLATQLEHDAKLFRK